MGTLAWIGVAVGAAAAVVVLGILVLGRGSSIAASRGARFAKLSRFAAHMSASWFGARLRRVFASKQRRVHLDAAAREANAKRLAETMGNMKGAFMKLGQMVSFISDDVPPEYRAALQSLQAEAPPMEFALIRDVVETELGRPLERAFARFETAPLAAASIGQVHRATLPDGEDVVVKVQYPGVAKAIETDLANTAVMYRMIAMMYPTLEPKGVIAELRARITEELDYEYEAKNQRAFCELYDGHPYIRVPRVVDEYSTARVLTSEYVAGRRFGDIESASQADRDYYGEILYRFVFGSSLMFRVFNGDPHPGNYLFDDDGKMVFLDFGCTKYFPEQMVRDWRKLLAAHLSGDVKGFKEHATALGFVPPNTKLTAEGLYEYFGYFYEPFRSDRSFTFNKEWSGKSFRMVFKPDGEFAGFDKQLNMPPDFVFVNRIQWGVVSVLSMLEATGNWHRIEREYVFGDPPATEMGEEIAAWRADWLARRSLTGCDVYVTAEGVVSDGNRPENAPLSA